jgi:NAD(P)-dependent dehydrogenase (short-subunit alcohol dehydrogenase family)
MTRTLAAEWGPLGLRVVAVSPGPFTSEGAETRLWPTVELEDKIRAQIPAGRFAGAGEVADAALWLLSDQARYCNGTILAIDGGWLLGGGGMEPGIVRRRRDGGPG